MTKRLTRLGFWPEGGSMREPGSTAGAQLTALQPIWNTKKQREWWIGFILLNTLVTHTRVSEMNDHNLGLNPTRDMITIFYGSVLCIISSFRLFSYISTSVSKVYPGWENNKSMVLYFYSRNTYPAENQGVKVFNSIDAIINDRHILLIYKNCTFVTSYQVGQFTSDRVH